MTNQIQGYCRLTYNAQPTGFMGNVKQLRGKILRVMEFANDGGALVLNADGNGLAMIEPEHIAQKFKCGQATPDILCPPDMDIVKQLLYAAKVNSRPEGYTPEIKKMIIGLSLMAGEFNDSFLWNNKPPEFTEHTNSLNLPLSKPLHAETVNDTSAIETHIAYNIDRMARIPMPDELTHILFTLLGSVRKPANSIPKEKKPPLMRLIENRVKACHTFTMADERATMFLAALAERPGFAVMYLWYLQYVCFYTGKTEITITDLAEIFMNGIPSVADMESLGKYQKVNLHEKSSIKNLYDHNEAGNSIHLPDTALTPQPMLTPPLYNNF